MTAGDAPDRFSGLVLAPRGRDAAIAAGLLEQVDIDPLTCRDVGSLAASLGDDVALVVLTEEAIRHADLQPLGAWIGAQPTWSDLPFILVTDHGGGPERNPLVRRWVDYLGNVAIVERPFHATTFLSVARAAAKGRRRQHETRALFEELHESEARLRTALTAGRLGSWEFDFGTARLRLAEDFRLEAGPAERSEFGADEFLAAVHADDRERVTEAVRRSVASGDDCVVEFRHTSTDGPERWLDVRARLLRDTAGGPSRLVGLVSDVSARKNAEIDLVRMNLALESRVAERTLQLQRAHEELLAEIAERARTEEQLRHVQKMESIGQLTGGVAHDFNNLLTAVLGNLDLLRKRVPPNPSTDRLIAGAIQGAQRGASLTQRLLAFARRQTLEARPVRLAGLVRGMDELLRRSLGPGIEIVYDLPDDVPAALVDSNQIELALLNLAVNGRDAMPGGGTLTIGLSSRLADDAPDLAAGRYVCLAVTDAGTGMDPSTLRRAAEPFFSTKEVGRGTGLGLSMVHGLAVQLKGALRLASEPGRGTRAEIWLPATEAATDAPSTRMAAEDSVAARGAATLLLVDDDFLIRTSTTGLLEDLGYAVIDAASGADALKALRTGRPVDLMIADYAMPGMTGVQLAAEARALRPGLPILLATGYAEVPTDAAMPLPRLSKPYQQRDLADHVRKLLSGRA